MKRKQLNLPSSAAPRRGSTLVIVIALLGLLMFTGMVFFTFASQANVASEYFSEAAKIQVNEPTDVWPHMLEHVLVGPSEKHRGSILYSADHRHSLVRNLVGSDIYPHNAAGISIGYGGSGEPAVLSTPSADSNGVSFLEFVDSPAARQGIVPRAAPASDVDYTYPDVNNLFLAYKGWAIRDNGGGSFSQVPVIIPSFFRPAYMRKVPSSDPSVGYSAGFTQNIGGTDRIVLTNPHWAYAYTPGPNAADPATPVQPDSTNRDTVLFQGRSFRPHPSHVAGVLPNGSTVLRYLTDDEAALPAINLAAGGFPFLPDDLNGNGLNGDLGIWTAARTSSGVFSPNAYELDADNDGDGVREGIWLDLHFPVQEFTDASNNVRKYVVLHSATIYDLDGLFNISIHGNLAGLPKRDSSGNLHTLSSVAAAGDLGENYLTRSHHGLGPNEVNPGWGLRRNAPFTPNVEEHMFLHYGAVPTNTIEQANTELIWLLTGRGDYEGYTVTRNGAGDITAINGQTLKDLIGGRWGDKNLLYNALEKNSPRLRIVDLPRPGLSGNVYQGISSGISFSGRNGVDDNQDSREGDAFLDGSEIVRRPFGHPMSFSGIGRRTQLGYPVFNPGTQQFDYPTTAVMPRNPLQPLFLRDTTSPRADQWPAYLRYGAASSMSTTNPARYGFGVDETYNGTNAAFAASGADDLNHNPVFNELFEDPLETVFDQDQADRVRDGLASIGDLLALQWANDSVATPQLTAAKDNISDYMSRLAPHAFDLDSSQREMFTTYSNALRYIAMRRSDRRPWEFTADSDGADQSGNDGIPDGDGIFEFPPRFGPAQPYSAIDPFRPQVRRILTNEVGENRDLIGALPLSVNHLLDVDRTARTPSSTANPGAFLSYMNRTGLRFRTLTEHPHISRTDASANDAIVETRVPTIEVTADADTNTVATEIDVPFPPTNFSEQEFWARRDRQQLARDIYVLLYTLGGAEQSGAIIRDYTGANDPNGAVGTVLYDHDQLRRMAQFAVNMVDAMDTDDVITKFEYDKNLGDGWNLDDDPFSADTPGLLNTDPNYDTTTNRGMYPEDNATRGVVYGVESQQLAISEVLAIHSDQLPMGAPQATLYSAARDHLFVELQNLLPQSIDLGTTESTTPEKAIWRLGRYDRVASTDPLEPADQPDRSIVFQDGAGTIAGGDNFTIATASTSEVVSSDFFVDHNIDGNYELIAPDVPIGAVPTTATNITDATAPELKPRCDLDLIHDDHATGRFVILDDAQSQSTTKGFFLDSLQVYGGNDVFDDLDNQHSQLAGDFGSVTNSGFDLVLQRRLNPHMPSLSNSIGQGTTVDVNPWVEVDRFRVTFDNFNVQPGDMAADIERPSGHLNNVRSAERAEILDDDSRQQFAFPTAVVDHRLNSIGHDFNNASLTNPTQPMNTTTNPVILRQVWQPHFDRDFASAGELLNLPLYGPNMVTQRLKQSRLAPQQQLVDTMQTPLNASGAAAVMLRPDFDPTTTTATHNDNRWYRLFQFVEVPSRVNRMLGNYLTQNRLPGKINLNMVRHMEVFAGLIDEPMFADIDANRNANPFLLDSTPGATRDRWREMIRERDGAPVPSGYDPTPGTPNSGDEITTGFLVPGTPNAEPFRSFDHRVDAVDDNGLEDTLFRMLNVDEADPDTNRTWLEVSTPGNHQAPALGTTPVERYQILSKIMNNTTNVSNTFVMFATAAYFEAFEDPATGFIRVGGRVNIDGGGTNNPGWQQRAVFVLDRSEAYNAFDRGSGDFDWERLVKYQAIIE